MSGRADTVGCIVATLGLGTQVYVIFGNDSWESTLVNLANQEPMPDAIASQDLLAAGGCGFTLDL